jgi:hypothetical protein
MLVDRFWWCRFIAINEIDISLHFDKHKVICHVQRNTTTKLELETLYAPDRNTITFVLSTLRIPHMAFRDLASTVSIQTLKMPRNRARVKLGDGLQCLSWCREWLPLAVNSHEWSTPDASSKPSCMASWRNIQKRRCSKGRP